MDPLLIIAAFFIILGLGASQIKKTKDGKIKDESITPKLVLEKLEEFTITLKPHLKYGYTEKSIQKQLDIYLKSYFKHITREYEIEGISGTKIDFDIGRGKVGLEVKLADSIFKSAGYQRMLGQLQEYSSAKYRKNNLIVLVAGSTEQGEERAMIAKLKANIENNNAIMLFVKIPKNQ
ncbi:MAG: hypothetical protein ACRBFS_14755 [Aureispira sp.]